MKEVIDKHITPRSKKNHGHKGTSEYNAWINMKARCYNLNSIKFHCYGGRGISVCKKWLESYLSFFEDMGKKPTPKHSLERINC